MAAPITGFPLVEEEGEERETPRTPEERGGLLARTGATRLAGRVERVQAVRGAFEDLPDEQPIEPEGFHYVDLPDPQGPDGSTLTPTSVTNFLFGDEMAVIGVKLDEEGWHRGLDVAIEQWAEEPLWVNLLATGSLIGTLAFPASKAITSSLKFGRLGMATGRIADHATEVAKFKGLGFLDEGVRDSDVSYGMLRNFRQLEHSRTKYEDFLRKTELEKTGELQLNPLEKLKFMWDKKFANTYFQRVTNIGNTGQIDREYAERLQRFWRNENLGRFFVDVPEEKAGVGIYAYMLRKANPDIDLDGIISRANPNFDRSLLRTSAEEERWADNLFDSMRAHQDEALQEGVISEATYGKIGEIHLSAFRKGTKQPELRTTRSFLVPVQSGRVVRRKGAFEFEGAEEAGIKIGAEEGEEYIALKSFEFPNLWAAQMKQRKADLPEVAERLIRGELITDPADLTFRNFVIDRMLLNNYKFSRDMIMQYGRRSDDIRASFGSVVEAKKRGWIPVSELGGEMPTTLTRMLNKAGYKVDDASELPFLHKSVFDELFGSHGMFAQGQQAANFVEALVSIHKTSKTAFCLDGETRILTDRGYIKIREAYDYKPGFNYNIPEEAPRIWSPVTEKWETVKATYHEEYSECIKIHLRNGTTIEGTLNHPVLSNGVKKRLSDLKVGDVIDSYLGGDFPKEYVKLGWNPWKDEVVEQSETKLYLNEDISELIGWFIGDGSRKNKNNSISITIGKDDFKWSSQRLSTICDRIGINYTISEDTRKDRNIFYFSIHNYRLINILKTLNVINNSTKIFRVPEYIYRSPKSVVCSFLRGLFDSDGYSSKEGEISLTQVHKDLISDIHLLLRWLGIESNINYQKGDKTIKFGEALNAVKEYKSHESWKVRFNSRRSKKIFVENQLFGMPRKLNRVSSSIKLNKSQNRSWKNRVVKVEHTGMKSVYDISLDNPHLFVAEGIVNHNSIPTHVQNLFGNFAFLAQGGFNPFSPSNLNLMRDTTKAFRKWADLEKRARRAGISARDLFDPKSGRLKGVNFGKIKVDGKTLDLNEELLDPRVRDLIEESAFQQAEGLAVVEDMAKRTGTGTVTKAMVKAALGIRNIGGPLTRKTFDFMTTSYLGEDMVPKLAYYLKLRAKGYARESAALEVGRRLPMYGTVGSFIRGGRRHVLPWVTFPAEAMRIFKNNLNDNPIKLLPWLMLPNITQLAMGAFGGGPPIGEVEERKRQLPPWAQTPFTIVQQGRKGAQIGAGVGLGGVGVAVGAAIGGAAGGVAGGAAGTALGVGMASMIDEEKNGHEYLRGAIMNWLPHSAFLPKSNSPDYTWDLGSTVEQLPIEPLAIVKTMMEIWSGRTSYDTKIGAEDVGDQLGKMVAGFVGFVAPPFFQRYGFKVTTPDSPLTQQVSKAFGEENPESVPGDITNVSRFLTETGQAIDPLTGKPGSFTFDFFINNTSGLWRSYAINPETRLINEGRQERHLSSIRSHLSRNLSFYLENGDDHIATGILNKVFKTFAKQYTNDPGMAQRKFQEWLDRRVKQIGRHPMLRNWSEDELRKRLADASSFSGQVRSRAREDMVRAIKKEWALRQRR